jgi:hypothetical protein
MTTRVGTHPDGTSFVEYFSPSGRHRDGDEPAVITVGELCTQSWWQHNRLHRVNNPAYIVRKNGNLLREAWYEDGVLHRAGGLPAQVSDWFFRPYGALQEWFCHGVKICDAVTVRHDDIRIRWFARLPNVNYICDYPMAQWRASTGLVVTRPDLPFPEKPTAPLRNSFQEMLPYTPPQWCTSPGFPERTHPPAAPRL